MFTSGYLVAVVDTSSMVRLRRGCFRCSYGYDHCCRVEASRWGWWCRDHGATRASRSTSDYPQIRRIFPSTSGALLLVSTAPGLLRLALSMIVAVVLVVVYTIVQHHED